MTTVAGVHQSTVTNESIAAADDASQLAPLGFELEVPTANLGMQVWIYVKTTEALVAGDVCKRGSSTTTISAGKTAAAHGGLVLGVAQHAIGIRGFGFILKHGVGTVKAGAETIDIGEAIYPSVATAGTACEQLTISGTAGNRWATPMGVGLVDIAAAATGLAMLDCRG
tara:strand:- start:56 stop:562 length:507 start_codon:yes stop_codon:yes gene_type:complete